MIVYTSFRLLRVFEYSDILGSDKKIKYKYSSLPKLFDRVCFFKQLTQAFFCFFFGKMIQANVLQSEFEEKF